MSEEMVPEEMKEIVEDFINESRESLDNLEPIFVDLEQDPGNLELINTVFRVVHSLKGAADFLGFPKVVTVAHKSESLFNLLRKEEMVLTPEIMDVVFEAVDVLKALVHEIETGEVADVDVEKTADRLVGLLEGGTSTKNVSPAETHPEIPPPRKESPKMEDVAATEATPPVPSPEIKNEEEPPSLPESAVEPKQTLPPKEAVSPAVQQKTCTSGVEQTIRVEVERDSIP